MSDSASDASLAELFSAMFVPVERRRAFCMRKKEVAAEVSTPKLISLGVSVRAEEPVRGKLCSMAVSAALTKLSLCVCVCLCHCCNNTYAAVESAEGSSDGAHGAVQRCCSGWCVCVKRMHTRMPVSSTSVMTPLSSSVCRVCGVSTEVCAFVFSFSVCSASVLCVSAVFVCSEFCSDGTNSAANSADWRCCCGVGTGVCGVVSVSVCALFVL